METGKHMAVTLSKEQLAKRNRKHILHLLLESMHNEKELRSQLAVLTAELKRSNQQMELAVIYTECFNEAKCRINGDLPGEPAMEEAAVSAHRCKKHAGKRKET